MGEIAVLRFCETCGRQNAFFPCFVCILVTVQCPVRTVTGFRLFSEKEVDTQENISYNPVFDTFLKSKVPQYQYLCGMWDSFVFPQYTLCYLFFVCAQIFFIFIMGMISVAVSNPKAACKSSVSFVFVYVGI